MKNLYFVIIFFITGFMCFSQSAGDTAVKGISPEKVFNYDSRSVSVRIFSRDVGDEKNYPVFMFGDLVNRAINYKISNPSEEVYIRFAIYKIGQKSYIGINPDDPESYAVIKGSDFAGENSENLLDLIIKAASNQVYFDFIYHKDNSKNEDMLFSLKKAMKKKCVNDSSKKVGDYLKCRKIEWGTQSFQQMHSKFITVSHYISDAGEVVENAVYTSTSNIDDHDDNGLPVKNWVQSGTLVSGHPEFKASYDKYFNIIYDNYDSLEKFQTEVRAKHADNSLNYDDKHLSSYFFPIPVSPAGNYRYVPETGDGSPSNGNAWDVDFNPIAKYVEMMANTSGNRYFKTNTYHLKMDNFGKKLYDRLEEIYKNDDGWKRQFRFVINTNSYRNNYPLSMFKDIGKIKEPALTHAKDTTFALSGLVQYFSVTGSTNLKLDANCSKANHTTVIKEYTTKHPVYNAFKEIYQYQYKD